MTPKCTSTVVAGWYHAHQCRQGNGRSKIAMPTSARRIGGVKFIECLELILRHRRLFLTGSGVIGVAVEVDDAVAMFVGWRVPFIVRQVGEVLDLDCRRAEFELVGAAYIHGVMCRESVFVLL
jgi:hypothetical protein